MDQYEGKDFAKNRSKNFDGDVTGKFGANNIQNEDEDDDSFESDEE